MQILPYCILLQDSGASIPGQGIFGSSIQELSEGALLALYSELVRSDISAKTFQPAALEFHKVVHTLFDQAAVVPFRFPTWLTPPELSRHLQEASQRYTRFLTDHARHAQMEVRLRASNTSLTNAMSGTAHLRARAAGLHQLRSTAEALKSLLTSEAIEWRERDAPQGLRLYALVNRTDIAKFREKLSEREHDVSVRWSGPWPATEFLSSAEI